MIRTAIAALFLTLYAVVLGPPLIVHALVTGSSETLYWVALWGTKFAARLAGVQVQVEGLENIPPGVCIFAANHTSAVDPAAVVGAIPRRISLLVKRELFRIPLAGTVFRVAKLLPVNRSDREAAVASVDQAIEYLRQGLSFLVYPEGTRSPDGRLRTFKKGTFVMAIRAGVPVVPISVVGAEKLMPKGALAVRPGTVRVRFHPPVDASSYTLDEKDELLARVYAAIASGLPESQQPIAAAVRPASPNS